MVSDSAELLAVRVRQTRLLAQRSEACWSKVVAETPKEPAEVAFDTADVWRAVRHGRGSIGFETDYQSLSKGFDPAQRMYCATTLTNTSGISVST